MFEERMTLPILRPCISHKESFKLAPKPQVTVKQIQSKQQIMRTRSTIMKGLTASN